MAITKHKTGSANPKVYVALLTQTTVSTTSGLLVVGKTYVINTLAAGDDFTNVGYVSVGTPFIATGTTPTVWTNSTKVINFTDSAPVATVLENSLPLAPTYSYVSGGNFIASAIGMFPLGKTCPRIENGISAIGSVQTNAAKRDSDDTIKISGALDSTCFEIHVYP